MPNQQVIIDVKSFKIQIHIIINWIITCLWGSKVVKKTAKTFWTILLIIGQKSNQRIIFLDQSEKLFFSWFCFSIEETGAWVFFSAIFFLWFNLQFHNIWNLLMFRVFVQFSKLFRNLLCFSRWYLLFF